VGGWYSERGGAGGALGPALPWDGDRQPAFCASKPLASFVASSSSFATASGL
jgi:hypothetical protein